MSDQTTIPRGSICRGCEYDLTGLSAPGVCPECGREFKELATDERIELDWRCLRCGYSLLGLRRNGKCSECGMPASISLDTTLFRFQPTDYRKRLKSGALCVGLGLLSMFFVPMFLAIVISVSIGALSGSSPGSAPDIVIGMAALAAFAMFLFGWFRILGRPPISLGLTSRQERIRRIARSSLVVFTVIFAASIILGLTVIAANINPAIADPLGGVIQIVSTLSFGVFFIAGLLALRPLFDRARTVRKRPGAIGTVTLWLGIVSMLGFLGSSLVFVAGAFYGGTGAMGVAFVGFGLIFGILMLVAFVTFFCYLGATESLRSALRRVEREIAAAHRTRLPPSNNATGETPGPPSPNNQPA